MTLTSWVAALPRVLFPPRPVEPAQTSPSAGFLRILGSLSALLVHPIRLVSSIWSHRPQSNQASGGRLPRLLWGALALFATGALAGCGGEDSAAQPISGEGMSAANPSINDNGDVAYDAALGEGARLLFVVPQGEGVPEPKDNQGEGRDPSIDDEGALLYLSGPKNEATVRLRSPKGGDASVTDQTSCFFPVKALQGRRAVYVCNAFERGQTLFVNALKGAEDPLNPAGTEVGGAALDLIGAQIAFAARADLTGPEEPEDNNGVLDIYFAGGMGGNVRRVSRDRAGEEREVPSDNPLIFEEGATILISYVTVFPQGDPMDPQWNQMVVIYDPLSDTVLDEIETDRPASKARRVDIRPYLGGEGGRYLLHLRASGLYLMDRRNPKRLIRIDPDATDGVMNAQGVIAYVNSTGRVFRTRVSNFF